MKEIHRLALIRYRSQFIKDVPIRKMANYLHQEGTIQGITKSIILARRIEEAGVEFLLDSLPRCGPNAWQTLLTGLHKFGVSHLAELLEMWVQEQGHPLKGKK